MTTERDLRNQMAYARQEAIEVGLAEGRAKGLAEGRIEGLAEGRTEGLRLAVNRMLDSGMSVEQVADIMQMSVTQVSQYSE